MKNGHTYYQPTEYEAQMIAAGMIAPGDVDADYLDYVQKAPHVADGEVSTYDQWLIMKHRWDELNERYATEVEPYYRDDRFGFPESAAQLGDRLLREMSQLEVFLGY